MSSKPEDEFAGRFNDDEIAYLNSAASPWASIIAHIATVAPDGQPDLSAVGYTFDGTHIYVGGGENHRTRKYRNIEAGNNRVVFYIDDSPMIYPRASRYLRVYGVAELVEGRPFGDMVGYGHDRGFGSPWYIKIAPRISWSSNLSAAGLMPSEGYALARQMEEDARLGRPGAMVQRGRRTVHDPALQLDRSEYWIGRKRT